VKIISMKMDLIQLSNSEMSKRKTILLLYLEWIFFSFLQNYKFHFQHVKNYRVERQSHFAFSPPKKNAIYIFEFAENAKTRVGIISSV
jgi:hypothetical protein